MFLFHMLMHIRLGLGLGFYEVKGPEGTTRCFDGSAYSFFFKPGKSNDLMIFFQGGGLYFNCFFLANPDPNTIIGFCFDVFTCSGLQRLKLFRNKASFCVNQKVDASGIQNTLKCRTKRGVKMALPPPGGAADAHTTVFSIFLHSHSSRS